MHSKARDCSSRKGRKGGCSLWGERSSSSFFFFFFFLSEIRK